MDYNGFYRIRVAKITHTSCHHNRLLSLWQQPTRNHRVWTWSVNAENQPPQNKLYLKREPRLWIQNRGWSACVLSANALCLHQKKGWLESYSILLLLLRYKNTQRLSKYKYKIVSFRVFFRAHVFVDVILCPCWKDGKSHSFCWLLKLLKN